MQYVLVVDQNQQPLMPCHPARARELLNKGKAVVFSSYPFTIIMTEREVGEGQTVALKIDPGSKTTGLALVVNGQRGQRVVWAADLTHRGSQIHSDLLSRRQLRRGRRQRKTRYRQPRFNNRRRAENWLPPSLLSRVTNVLTWVQRLGRFAPISRLTVEQVRFDTQALQNPEISGVEYQQGELMGYEIREYLLEKWKWRCAYCGVQHIPLEVEHLTPKSRGGTNRVSNLTLACHDCNQRKDNQTAEEFGFSELQQKAKQPLRDAAAVNATRWRLWQRLTETGLPVEVGTGGQTKYHRTQRGYPKAHWVDAACVGTSGAAVYISTDHRPLSIAATGRQSRQMCLMNRYGFPRTTAKQSRLQYGFQTGDIVQAVITRGKRIGTYNGRVTVRRSGSFNITTSDGTLQGVSYRYCQILHHADGYHYTKGVGFRLITSGGVSRA